MKSLAHLHEVGAIGSTFEIRDLHSNELETYTLTRPNDADITLNRISSLAPVGRALYGRRPGETVEIKAPGGRFCFRIEAIESGFEEQHARAG
jgi:transcription elongation GreA/GreB family factor